MYVYNRVKVYTSVIDATLKRGVPFSEIMINDILAAVPNMTFEGVTGPVAFDRKRDMLRYGGYSIGYCANTSTFSFKGSVVYNPSNDTFIGSFSDFKYYGRSSSPPSAGYCVVCVHSTCSNKSVCMCMPGYQGIYCINRIQGISQGWDLLPGLCTILSAYRDKGGI